MTAISDAGCVFNPAQLLACIPQEVLLSEEFLCIKQLAITHSEKSSSWFDGTGSLYDFEAKKFVRRTQDFNVLNEFFKGTYLETVVLQVNEIAATDGVKIGRIRLLLLDPCTCYTLHIDPEEFRYHIPVMSNDKCFFVSGNEIARMPKLGKLYMFKTKDVHTAVNASRERRLHLVFDTYK